MASMTLFVASSLKSVTVHANNSYYPQTFGPGTHTLSNLPSSGNIWIVPANDVTFASGYGSPVNVTTQNPSGSWKLDNDNYIAITDGRSITLTGTQGGSHSSFNVKVVLGAGIKAVSWVANKTDLTNSNVAHYDFTVDVGSRGYLYIGIAQYTENYTYPVTASASSGTSSWTVINANGVYADREIRAPGISGTRTVTLTATKTPTYVYARFYANGGSWSSGSDPYTESVESGSYASTETPSGRVYRSGDRLLGWSTSSTATSATYSTNEAIGPLGASISLYAVWEENPYITLDAGDGRFGTDRYVYFHIDYGGYVYFSNYNPTRAGYALIGWSATSGATSPTYGPTDYVGPLYGSSYKFYAVWQQSTATITLIGNGGKWDDATGIIQLTRNVGDVLNFGSYSSLTRTGYTLLGWSANSAATSATYGVNGTVDVGASDATYYAVWQKITIGLFYWNSASTDASLIAAGQPISNMTATRWNRFKAKIAELAEAEGGSYSYSTAASGDTFYATEFNDVRTAIMNRSGYGTIPAAQASGNAVKASLFEGSGSLKTALNAAITHYNNS